MFFIGGIMDGKKLFSHFRQVVTCGNCGQYAAFEAFMTYTYFMFFFIPLFKWNRHYFVRSTCCGSVWEIPREKGEAIARGEEIALTNDDLTPTMYGRRARVCPACGTVVEGTFKFCPHCGKEL